jgi:hypothetical protein
MRTLLAALAFALAIPATATPAAACGGEYDLTLEQVLEATRPVRHVATGQVGGELRRNDAGQLAMFISYPEIDGAFSGLYGIFADLRDDRRSRAFARDHARWSKRFGGSPVVTVELERVGETGAWRLVSYRLGAD